MSRKFLFSLLTLSIFLAVCAYVLITAQGTKIDDGGNIVNTSILRLNSIPVDVTVYINGQQAKKTENRVEWLEPGTAHVKLTKSGYVNWEKNIELTSGIIEDVYAQLFPEKVTSEKLSSVNIDQFFFAQNTDYIFYSVINGESAKDNGLWKLKLKRNLLDIGTLEPSKVYTFTSEELTKLRKNLYNIEVSDNYSKFLLDLPGLKELYYIDSNNTKSVYLNDILSFYPDRIDWLNSDTIITSNGTLLVSYNLNSREQNLIYYSASKSIIYTTSGSIVYYLRFDKNKIFALQNGQTTEVETPVSFIYPVEMTNLYSSKENNKIIYVLGDGILQFINLDKDLTTAFINVKGVTTISPDGLSVVYTDNENQLQSLIQKSSQDNKTYTSKIHPLPISSADLAVVTYNSIGKNLMVLTQNKKDQIVWMMDSDGMNPVKVLVNKDIQKNNIAIDTNSLSLYGLMADTSDTAKSETISSIYKFNLEVK